VTASQQFTYLRTYSRWIPEAGRRETYGETVVRYLDFMKAELGDAITQAQLNQAANAILNMEAMPSMRAFWAAGEAARSNNITLYNCSYCTINHIKAFSEVLYILMCGTGAGFSVERQFVDQLPELQPKANGEHNIVVVVEDSKEGWATALNQVLVALWQGFDPRIDYSRVRPRGARLITMGGRASGPDPLRDLFEFCRRLFDAKRAKKQRRLAPIDCLDILNKIAEIVVVGGVRRSSEISLSDLEDRAIGEAKMGEFWQDHPHRAMSNNSAVYHGRPDVVTFFEEFTSLIRSKAGERGIFNREGALRQMMASGRRNPLGGYAPANRTVDEVERLVNSIGTNPCVTGDTVIATLDGPKTFAELAAVGKDVMVYAWHPGTKRPVVRWMRRPRKTRSNAELVEVAFDSGLKLRCTPDHDLFTFRGEKVKARDLLPGQSVRAFSMSQRVSTGKSPKTSSSAVMNHKVVSVQSAGREDVYNGTVDDAHTYVILDPVPVAGQASGIISANCGEIILRDMQFCNLSEVVVRSKDTLETLKRKVRTATMFGAWQSTFTNFPLLRPEWEANCREERLLGVSLTGIMDNAILNNVNDKAKRWLGELKAVAITEAEKWARRLNINMSAAITCVKPSGTISQVVDCASGIHQRYNDYYIRRYRISATDPLFRLMRDQGVPWHPENGQDPAAASTMVLEFPIAAPKGAKTRHDYTAMQQLDHWKMVKEFWCEHNPSITVYVGDDEWARVAAWVYDNFDDVCGISFLPRTNHVYNLAPYQDVTQEEYQRLAAAFPQIDYSKLSEYEQEDNTSGSKSYACVGDRCELA
jgi:ribonucleotide reductase alpha subunit